MTLPIRVDLPGQGTLALVGSGEYLPPMLPVDRYLISLLSEPARVVCLATAAGTESPERLAYWDRLGEGHFASLGVVSVHALPVYDRASAEDEALAAQVAQANFVYLSGGKPPHLYNSLQGTPVWKAIFSVLEKGGVLAGCSAGAMIFGERVPSSIFSKSWMTGFGFLPGTFIMPHFDELPGLFARTLPHLDGELTLLGVEGNTALVCRANGCQVIGKGGVTVANKNGSQRYTQEEPGI